MGAAGSQQDLHQVGADKLEDPDSDVEDSFLSAFSDEWDEARDGGAMSASSSAAPVSGAPSPEKGCDSKCSAITAGPNSAPSLLLNSWALGLITKAVDHHSKLWEKTLKEPFRDTRRQMMKQLQDLALTRAQQEVVGRVMQCNKNFWDVSVEGKTPECPKGLPWNRHMSLNLALLAVYHTDVANERCRNTLAASAREPPPWSRSEAEEALRFCRWAHAMYLNRFGHPPPSAATAAGAGVVARDELAVVAADPRERAVLSMAGAEGSVIVASELCDTAQAQDPLCPRYIITADHDRQEVVFAVRGTSSLSDAMVDLIGDPVPFAGGMAHAGIVDGARRLYAKTAGALERALLILQEPRSLRRQTSCSSAGSERPPPRLVLTGHSLGAGVAELLAILLLGADAGANPAVAPLVGGCGDERATQSGAGAGGTAGSGGGDGWRLPPHVRLAMYLYAPPPVYKANVDQEASSAVQAARKSAVAFAINYDIIPRTSLHNGFNLCQQARVVDRYARVRKRDIFKLLSQLRSKKFQEAETARRTIINLVSDAIVEAAAGPPAAPNPFARQHPVAERVYHLSAAVGGTSALSTSTPSSPSPAPRCPADGDEAPASTSQSPPLRGRREGRSLRALAQEASGLSKCHLSLAEVRSLTLYKKSQYMGEWRLRYAWINDGCLCFSKDEALQASTFFPITAASTIVCLFGEPSPAQFPESIVYPSEDLLDSAADDTDTGAEPADEIEEASSFLAPPRPPPPQARPPTPHAQAGAVEQESQPSEDGMGPPPPPPSPKRVTKVAAACGASCAPTAWGFRIQNCDTRGLCPISAATLNLCAESAVERDAWIWRLVGAVRAARRVSFAVGAAMQPEEWGTEALVADSCTEDHSMPRYEIALECLCERLPAA